MFLVSRTTQKDNVEIMSCSHLSYTQSDKETLITIAELTRYCGADTNMARIRKWFGLIRSHW